MHNKRVYFPNLNGLRFIAALMVVLHHIEQRKSVLGFANCYNTNSFISASGKLGVVLFFVLSGFLITFLLLAEEHQKQNISIKKFYVRRVLRIWPLYFLIIFISFAILPNVSFFETAALAKTPIYDNLMLKIGLYVFFLPNLVGYLAGVVPYASHLWSIGAEEQFYFVWPLVIKFSKQKKLLAISGVAILYVCALYFFKSYYCLHLPYRSVIVRFMNFCNIQCMAIGGIFSYLLFSNSKILRLLLNNYIFYFVLLLTVCFIALGIKPKHFYYEMFSVLFGIIILNFAENKTLKISLENKLFTFLGNISFGIYMYHPIAIGIALHILTKINLANNWFLYPTTFLITVAFAHFSYTYFERFFLQLKSKFTTIESGKINTVEYYQTNTRKI